MEMLVLGNQWQIRIYLMVQLLLLSMVFCTDNKALEESLHSNIFNVWSYRSNFSDFSSLKSDQESINKGIKQDGIATTKGLKRIFDKVLRGLNITMLVLGGSSTKGADLGCNNTQCTYHYAFTAWWNTIVAPSTGSYLKRIVIAVGGAGTTYFSHCWKEYLLQKDTIDLVLWEFFLNDPDSTFYGSAVEKFVRSVYSYRTQPVLIFNEFFCPHSLPGQLLYQSTSFLNKKKLLETISNYYGFSIMDLFASVDYHMKSNFNHRLTVTDMFIDKHPSHLAHAQLTYLLIEYVRKKLFDFLSEIRHKRTAVAGPTMYDDSLPSVLYDVLDEPSICWSAVMPDDRFIMPHYLYNLRVTHNDGFSIYRTPLWRKDIANRRDVRGGYITRRAGKSFSLMFNIPRGSPKNVYLAISHEQDGGDTSVVITDSSRTAKQTTLNCSRKVVQAMDIHFLGIFPPGNTVLSMRTINGGCHFSAIIIE